MTEPYGFVKNMRFYRSAYLSNELPNGVMSLLALIITYADQDGRVAYFSIQKTAQRRCVTRQAIQNQVRRLVEKEYIFRNRKSGQRNEYLLNFQKTEIDATQSDCVSSKKAATELSCGGAISILAGEETVLSCIKKPLDNKKKTQEVGGGDEWRRKIKQQLGETLYKSWIDPLIWDGETLMTTELYIANWVNSHYLMDIRRYLPIGKVMVQNAHKSSN